MTLFYSIDLEMEQPSNEIISIGIAVGSDLDGIIFSKNYLITPSKPISQKIQDLTGLKDDMFDWTLSREACLYSFIYDFETLVNLYNLPLVPITWGSGDSHLLAQEWRTHMIPVATRPSRMCIDLKQVLMWEHIIQRKPLQHKMSLKTACHQHSVKQQGPAHNSEADAVTTLLLFFEMKRRGHILNDAIDTIRKYK